MGVGLGIAAAAGSLIGGGLGVVGALQQGSYDAKVAQNNARLARWQASAALAKGGREAGKIAEQGSRQNAAAMASAAGSGVELTSGSMANMFAGGEANVAADVETAKYNATLEAWGLKNEASQQIARAKQAKRSSILGAVSSGIGGIAGAASAGANTYYGATG